MLLLTSSSHRIHACLEVGTKPLGPVVSCVPLQLRCHPDEGHHPEHSSLGQRPLHAASRGPNAFRSLAGSVRLCHLHQQSLASPRRRLHCQVDCPSRLAEDSPCHCSKRRGSRDPFKTRVPWQHDSLCNLLHQLHGAGPWIYQPAGRNQGSRFSRGRI